MIVSESEEGIGNFIVNEEGEYFLYDVDQAVTGVSFKTNFERNKPALAKHFGIDLNSEAAISDLDENIASRTHDAILFDEVHIKIKEEYKPGNYLSINESKDGIKGQTRYWDADYIESAIKGDFSEVEVSNGSEESDV